MEHRDEYGSEAAAPTAIMVKLVCSPDSLRVLIQQVQQVQQVQRDGSERPGQTISKRARIRKFECEVRELRQGQPAADIIPYLEMSRF
jgi:hypothetical protein